MINIQKCLFSYKIYLLIIDNSHIKLIIIHIAKAIYTFIPSPVHEGVNMGNQIKKESVLCINSNR